VRGRLRRGWSQLLLARRQRVQGFLQRLRLGRLNRDRCGRQRARRRIELRPGRVALSIAPARSAAGLRPLSGRSPLPSLPVRDAQRDRPGRHLLRPRCRSRTEPAHRRGLWAAALLEPSARPPQRTTSRRVRRRGRPTRRVPTVLRPHPQRRSGSALGDPWQGRPRVPAPTRDGRQTDTDAHGADPGTGRRRALVG